MSSEYKSVDPSVRLIEFLNSSQGKPKEEFLVLWLDFVFQNSTLKNSTVMDEINKSIESFIIPGNSENYTDILSNLRKVMGKCILIPLIKTPLDSCMTLRNPVKMFQLI
jgi:hypothetical protein